MYRYVRRQWHWVCGYYLAMAAVFLSNASAFI